MKESLWGYYLILLGITVSSVMILMSNLTTTSQQDYYLLKEVTNASMIDSIDFGYYRKYKEVRINREKFVEVFLRRFSEGTTKNNSYKIDFYSLNENPPSVSIRVTASNGEFHITGDDQNIDVVNSIDAILEANNAITYTKNFYSMPYDHCLANGVDIMDDDGYCQISTKVQFNMSDYFKSEELNKIKDKVNNRGLTFDENKIKVSNVTFLSVMKNEDLIEYYNNFVGSYNYISNGGEFKPDEYGVTINNTSDYLAKVKNVKITVLQDDAGNLYPTWGAQFKCEKNFGDENIIKQYYYDSSFHENKKVETKDSDNWVPYYDNCLVGIKYKVDFYYDI